MFNKYLKNNKYYLKYRQIKFQRLLLSCKSPHKLNLGAGNVILSEYINIDIRKLPGIDLIADVADLSFIVDESIDEIYTCHTLEHISHQTVLLVLKEWLRVIKPGGKLVLSVPDFDKIIRIYSKTGKSVWNIKSPLMGEQDYLEDAHYAVFNYQYLEQILLHAGFTKVELLTKKGMVTDKDWSFRKIKMPDGQEFDISLNVAAVK